MDGPITATVWGVSCKNDEHVTLITFRRKAGQYIDCTMTPSLLVTDVVKDG